MLAKHIGIFITGGIAAYKTPQLIRDLIRAGHDVRVAMTQHASEFVTSTTLATVSKQPVLTDEAALGAPGQVAHVEMAQWLDLAVVVPATANTMAKLAAGLADNIVTTTLLADNGPKLIVPAMNDQMWLNPQTQENVQQLKAHGWQVLQPATGFLAEGYQGVGRMQDLAVIEAAIDSFQPTSFLAGKRVLISAGGTRERLDPVRYLSNDSSGKMGTALANVAAAAGAEVTLVTTASQPVLPAVQVVPVGSAADMANVMKTHFDDCDIAIMAAAVADYRPAKMATQKLKKTDDKGDMILRLKQNPDILAELGATKHGQFVVGFAAETDDLLTNASAKLKRKQADMLVANIVGPGKGFDQLTNTVTVLRPKCEPLALPEMSKTMVAEKLLHVIIDTMAG